MLAWELLSQLMDETNHVLVGHWTVDKGDSVKKALSWTVERIWLMMGLYIAELRDAALLVKIQLLFMKHFSGAVILGYTTLWWKLSFLVHSMARYLIIIQGTQANGRLVHAA